MGTLTEITSLERETAFKNEALKVIYQRRAIRKYKDISIDKNSIEKIIDAGRMAPSAMNKQPWKFYILTNKEEIKVFSKEISKAVLKGVAHGIAKSGLKGILKLGKEILHFPHATDFFKLEDPVFHGAPVVIFITTPKDNEWAVLDVGMCSQNIMLAAKSMGIDSCPVGVGKFVEHTKIYSMLNIPNTEQVQLSIILGYGDENPVPNERNKNNVIFL